MDGRVLGLDMSSSLGWAIAEVRGQNSVIVESGLKVMKSNDEDVALRLIRFLDFLNRKVVSVDRIYFEDVSMFANMGRPGATGVWSQMYAIMIFWAYNTNTLRQKIHPTTLKKQFTGNHKASKEEMCAAAHALGWTGGKEGTKLDHDEADAIGLIVVGEAEYGRKVTVLPKK